MRRRWMPILAGLVLALGIVGAINAAFAQDIAIPPRTWVDKNAIIPYPGMYYCSWECEGKDGMPAMRTKPGNEELWFAHGDWYSYNDIENPNGSNEVWSYNAATDVWTKQYPPGPTPCAPAGDIVPAQPDESTWIYDSTRDVFYTFPGFWFGSAEYQTHCTDATPVMDALVFNPTTLKYSSAPFPPPPDGWGGDVQGSKNGVYDPITDSVYRFRFTSMGCQCVEILHLATNTWDVVPLDLDGAFLEQDHTVIDVQGRAIYGVDYAGKQLVKWSIDARTSTPYAFPANYVWPCDIIPDDCNNNAFFSVMSLDTVNRLILVADAPDHANLLHAYYFFLDTATWVEDPLSCPGCDMDLAAVNGDTIAYDSVHNVHLLTGMRSTKHFFLFRYGP